MVLTLTRHLATEDEGDPNLQVIVQVHNLPHLNLPQESVSCLNFLVMKFVKLVTRLRQCHIKGFLDHLQGIL